MRRIVFYLVPFQEASTSVERLFQRKGSSLPG